VADTLQLLFGASTLSKPFSLTLHQSVSTFKNMFLVFIFLIRNACYFRMEVRGGSPLFAFNRYESAYCLWREFQLFCSILK